MNRSKSNRANRLKFPTLKMQWEGRKGSAATFVGMKQYEEWAMGLSTPTGPPIQFDKETVDEWMTPEEFQQSLENGSLNEILTPKEALWQQGVEIRRQLDDAIANEEFERCRALQQVLDVIEIKYNNL